MNAQELYTEGGKAAGIFYCGECKKLAPLATDKAAAEACCRPKLCECGNERETFSTKCKPCRDTIRRKAQAVKWEAAELIDTQPENTMLFDGSEYYDDVEDYEEYICNGLQEDIEDHRGDELLIATFDPIEIRGALDMIEIPAEDLDYEDAYEIDTKDLDKAIKEFNERMITERRGSYYPSYKQKIKL